jgi:hypothetical protein
LWFVVDTACAVFRLSCIVESKVTDGAAMSEKALDPDFLAEYEKESEWAEGHGVHQRTVARYRALGLPYVLFGGFIWVHKRGGREWIASRVKRRNTRSRGRQTRSAQSEASAAAAPKAVTTSKHLHLKTRQRSAREAAAKASVQEDV